MPIGLRGLFFNSEPLPPHPPCYHLHCAETVWELWFVQKLCQRKKIYKRGSSMCLTLLQIFWKGLVVQCSTFCNIHFFFLHGVWVVVPGSDMASCRGLCSPSWQPFHTKWRESNKNPHPINDDTFIKPAPPHFLQRKWWVINMQP